MFASTCVVFGLPKWVWRMSRATVDTATARDLAFLVAFASTIFSITIFAFSLAILAGLIAAASWWFQSLRVSAHFFA